MTPRDATDTPEAWLATRQALLESWLASLVDINSFSANRDGCQRTGDLLASLLRLPGLEVQRVAAGPHADHLVARTAASGEGRPTVLLLGHLDTVFPPGIFEGYRVDGALRRGPGVLDMKGGLVVAVAALHALHHSGGLQRAPPLKLVVVSDEEVGSPDSTPLIQREASGVAAALVLESGRHNDAVVTRRKGLASVRVTASGRPAHAGNNYWDGASAVWALARFVDGAQRLSRRDEDTTVNVGLFQGGTSRNTVPAQAQAEVDVRFVSTQAQEAVSLALEACARQAEASVPGTSLSLTPLSARPPMAPTDATAALLQAYGRCATRFGLGASEAPLQGGGSDGNTTAALGIPTLDGLGPRGRYFHTPREYIEADTLVARAQALATFLLDFPGGAGGQ